MKKLFLILITLCIFISCDNPYADGTMIFVRHKGADMPVYIKGNLESKTALMVIHGGPGGDSMIYTALPSFQTLEENYAVIYWDQRSSGSAQGNAQDETLTVEQYVEDTDMVLDTVQSLYNFSSFFILGHSWGGCLGTAYVIDPSHQAKIKGWIEVDGGHNLVDGLKYSREWVIRYAKTQSGKYWTEALAWYEKTPVITHELSVISTHCAYVTKAHGYTHDEKNSNINMGSYIFLSPATFPGNTLAQLRPTTSLWEIWYGSYNEKMPAVTIPTLILWGAHDGILPVELAQDAYDALGTPAEHKSIVIFENSAHSPMIEEGEKFAQSVINFMNTYR
jgi:proline iminopeptidase